MTDIVNPLAILFLFAALRFSFDKNPSVFLAKKNDVSDIANKIKKTFLNVYQKLETLSVLKARHLLLLILAISFIIKILNSYFYFGFFSGDDVEVQEMTFAHLYDWDWKAWALRSPIFPMIFIFPIQWALLQLGINDPAVLIFAGRFIVVLFSLLNLLLVYKISKRLFESIPISLLSTFIFALSKIHTTFASSELPRTVASFFVLIALWFIIKNTKQHSALAGIVLAVGACLRFSEIIFIVPALLLLFLNKKYSHIFIFSGTFLFIFVLIIGISDTLYWKSAFFSLKNIIDFSFAKKLSTRGYQSISFYFLNIGSWADFFMIGLASVSVFFKTKKIWIWALAPIIILSMFPHKEPRYLVPVIPFVAILAAVSVWNIAGLVVKGSLMKLNLSIPTSSVAKIFYIIIIETVILSHKDHRYVYISLSFIFIIVLLKILSKRKELKPKKALNNEILITIFVFILSGMLLFELRGFRFYRSESAVELARYVASSPVGGNIAAEQSWKLGSNLYLNSNQVIKDIDITRVNDEEYMLSFIQDRSLTWISMSEKSLIRYKEIKKYLQTSGWEEVDFKRRIKRDKYVLFRRKSELFVPVGRKIRKTGHMNILL